MTDIADFFASFTSEPGAGRKAIKIINHYGDEVLKVYEVPE